MNYVNELDVEIDMPPKTSYKGKEPAKTQKGKEPEKPVRKFKVINHSAPIEEILKQSNSAGSSQKITPQKKPKK